MTGEFLHSTFPEGEAAKDPSYLDGSGTSVVRYEVPLSALPKGIDPTKLTMKATLYYQSIPPYYLMQRFEQAPNARGHTAPVLFDLTARHERHADRKLEASDRLQSCGGTGLHLEYPLDETDVAEEELAEHHG